MSVSLTEVVDKSGGTPRYKLYAWISAAVKGIGIDRV